MADWKMKEKASSTAEDEGEQEEWNELVRLRKTAGGWGGRVCQAAKRRPASAAA
jgi:hypothetical protein